MTNYLKIPKITILGGGTAGWLTALYINEYYQQTEIVVIEDPSKPPIIAGESGGAALSTIYNRLGIDIKDWVKTVHATPKLGGIFTGWNGKDHTFYHSLITSYTQFWEKDFPSIEERYYYLRHLIGLGIKMVDITPTGYLLINDRVPLTENLQTFQNTSPMWHFDSRANADYLKQLGLNRGIKLIQGRYTHANKDDSGNIIELVLDNTQVVSGDWFFDCSGFARLLLEKELDVKSEDLSSYFPARAVLPWWDNTCLKSSTIARTMDAGWSWQIGLSHRTGQGYLYDPDFLTEDQALEEIHKKFGSHIEPVAKLSFTPSILKESMKKNVVGIGLSTGFIEPLEANGTGIIVDALLILNEVWSPYNTTDKQIEENFNKKVYRAYNSIKDFLSLHYRGKGSETDFWKAQQQDYRIPDSLAERIDEWTEFYRTGKIDLTKYLSQYSIESWLTVLQGLDIIDHRLIEMSDEMKGFILGYYQQEKQLSKDAQEKCVGIEEWNKIIQRL